MAYQLVLLYNFYCTVSSQEGEIFSKSGGLIKLVLLYNFLYLYHQEG